jgi:hypothetical protein
MGWPAGSSSPRTRVQKRKRLRLTLALIFAAPIAATVVLMLFIGVTSLISGGFAVMLIPQMFIYGPIAGAMVGWPSTLLWGLPSHIFLYRSKRRKPIHYIIAGLIGGAITTGVMILLIYGAVTAGGLPAIAFVIYFVMFIGAGAGSGWLFWWIRRPDRDMEKTVDLEEVFA